MIFLAQYLIIAILCVKMSSVYKPLVLFCTPCQTQKLLWSKQFSSNEKALSVNSIGIVIMMSKNPAGNSNYLNYALFTRDILTHNITIKIYFDKKTFFIQYFFSCVNWKYLFLDNSVPQMSMDTRICIENHRVNKALKRQYPCNARV